ncbi:MAG: hypothetical protein JNM97_23470 [Rhodoferax sp.]|nr:hypothetical protein [Rhodoferax sp.]
MLLVTLGLTAVALWMPRLEQAPIVPAADQRARETPVRGDAAAVRVLADRLAKEASPAWPQPLPQTVPALRVLPAKCDIFAPPSQGPARTTALIQAKPAKPQAEPVSPPLPTVSPPVGAVAAPPPRVRYLGTMRTPEGERLVLLLRGEVAIVARAGLQLEDGYSIQSIETAAVRLLHGASGQLVDVHTPALDERTAAQP